MSCGGNRIKTDIILGFPWMKDNRVQFDYFNQRIVCINDVDREKLLSGKQLRKSCKKDEVGRTLD